jgi:hypothetical protein
VFKNIKKWLAIIGGAVLALGSLGLGLRALLKKHVQIIRIPLGAEETVFKNVKAIVHYEIIDEPKHRYDMEDIINTMFLEKLNTVIVIHKITREMALDTLGEILEDYDKELPPFEEMNNDELISFLPDYWCEKADIIKKSLEDGPVFYSIRPDGEMHYVDPELDKMMEDDEDDYSE